MDAGRNPNKTIVYGYKSPNLVDWTPFLKETAWDAKVLTGLPLAELRKLAERLTDIPSKFKLHSRVEKIVSDRRLMGEGKLPLDWGMAETLAYAALLNDGYPIRISGQDSGRGTFFHRHAVLHDQNRERWSEGTYIPLRHIKPDQPDFVIIDSVLSEEAVLAFEYG
jgi:2-oxoglutarate dehydrogenase E1 component